MTEQEKTLDFFRDELQKAQGIIKITKTDSRLRKTMSIIVSMDKSAIKAIKKQISKKTELWNGQAGCPCCKSLLGPNDLIEHKPNYCEACGQALNWG